MSIWTCQLGPRWDMDRAHLLIVGHWQVGDVQVGVILVSKSLQALVVRDL